MTHGDPSTAPEEKKQPEQPSIELQDRLDEELDESFPASDPPTVTNPSGPA